MLKMFSSGSKKGQVDNYLAALTVIFVFSIIAIIGAVLMVNVKSAYVSAGIYNGTLEETGDKFVAVYGVYDVITVLIMVILGIGIGLTSFRLASAPAFFIVSIILGSFYAFVSYFFSFLFQEIVSNAVLASVLSIFPRTIMVCTNLHWVGLLYFAIGSITLYAKKEKGQFVE